MQASSTEEKNFLGTKIFYVGCIQIIQFRKMQINASEAPILNLISPLQLLAQAPVSCKPDIKKVNNFFHLFNLKYR
jgi:hypothetical protein